MEGAITWLLELLVFCFSALATLISLGATIALAALIIIGLYSLINIVVIFWMHKLDSLKALKELNKVFIPEIKDPYDRF